MTIPRGDDLSPAFGLMPDIVWGIDPQWEARCEIPIPNYSPPAHLRHLHDPWFFKHMWGCVLSHIRTPVRVHEGGAGRRLIEVLGDVLVERAPDGQMTIRAWECREIGRPLLVELPAKQVALVGMPWRTLWLAAMAKNASVEVRHWAFHRIPGQQREVTMAMAADYSTWAFGIYEKQIRRHCDLRLMRRKIADAVDLDPWVVTVAARLIRQHPLPQTLMMGEYNLVLRHRASFESLWREAPHLVPLFGALCESDYFPSDGAPTARLKHYLREWLQGATFTWRLLVHGDNRALQPVRDFYRGPVDVAVRDYVRFLFWLRLHEQPPAWLIRQVLNLWGDTENRQDGYWTHIFGYQEGGYGHVVQAFLRHHGRVATPDEGLVNEVELVLRWARDSGELGQLDTPRRKGGWPWLVRRSQRWQDEHERRLSLDPHPWPAPFVSVHREGFTAYVLADELALWEEARAMHHCANTLAERCRKGETMLLSIRRDDQRVCTLGLIREYGKWDLWQAKGKANAPVSPQLKASLLELVHQINQWERHNRLRQRMARL